MINKGLLVSYASEVVDSEEIEESGKRAGRFERKMVDSARENGIFHHLDSVMTPYANVNFRRRLDPRMMERYGIDAQGPK